MIQDRRTPEEVAATVGFIVATDRFMSGWGHAPGRSLFAVPFRAWEDVEKIRQWLDARPEMLRVRVVGKHYRPKLREGDHLSICSME